MLMEPVMFSGLGQKHDLTQLSPGDFVSALLMRGTRSGLPEGFLEEKTLVEHLNHASATVGHGGCGRVGLSRQGQRHRAERQHGVGQLFGVAGMQYQTGWGDWD